MQCVKHYVPIDVEYGCIRTHLSEYVTVSDGTLAFTHVDVKDFNEDNSRGKAYPSAVETINSYPVFEDMSLMQSKEPPIYPPSNPLLLWKRRDGEETTTLKKDLFNTI
eukprot:85217-Amphidinium_carterae.1